MVYLKAFGVVYLFLGFVYAVYVALNGRDKWFMFPINVLGGPIAFLYIILVTIQGKRSVRS